MIHFASSSGSVKPRLGREGTLHVRLRGLDPLSPRGSGREYLRAVRLRSRGSWSDRNVRRVRRLVAWGRRRGRV